MTYNPDHPLIDQVEDDGNPFREGDRILVGGRLGFVEHCWSRMVDTVTLPHDCRPWIIHTVSVAMDDGRRKTFHVSDIERAPATAPQPPWRSVLGDSSGRPMTRDKVLSHYKWLANKWHPDHGGSNAAMAMLNVARDRALAEVSGSRRAS